MTTPVAPPSDTPPPPAPLPKVSAGPKRTLIGGGDDHRGGALSATLGLMVRGGFLGYVAIVVGWAVTEQAGIADARSAGPVALYVATLGAVYGLFVGAAADVRDRVWDRALVRAAIGTFAGAVVGAISGVASSALFDALQQTEDPTVARFYVLRGLAWAVFGIGIGLIGGLTERSSRKALNGLLGGLIGGALGGALFHWVGLRVDDASAARLIGLVCVGTLIGVAIGIVEGARRHAWLRIVAGGLAGKEFILQHEVTTIGAAPKCQITLIKDPGAAPFHAAIATVGGRRTITPIDGAPVLVNGSPVRSRVLRAGDQLQIGATTLVYQDRD